MHDPRHIQKAQKILNYWHTIEFFAQDKYDSMRDVQEKVKAVKESYRRGTNKDKTLWDYVEQRKPADPYNTVSAEAAACGMKEWGNITVYIGRIRREACIEYIAGILTENEEEKRYEQSYEEIAWASFQLAPDGTYIENTLSLSTVIWAMSRIGSSDRLSACIDERMYKDTVKELEEEFFGREKDAPAKHVYGETLRSLSKVIEKRFIKDSLGTADKGSYQENYGLHFQLFLDEDTKKKREDDNYIGLSHAYFLSDIRLVSEAVDNGQIRGELLRYIDILENEKEFQPRQIDLVFPKEQGKFGFLRQISEILEVKNAPLGKWPSRYMPALMQQIAVNLGMKKGESELFNVNGTVFSVNGPPGTGKTTLLKEIVAGNIIERAALLAEYEEPDSAFDRHPFLRGEGEGGAYYKYVRYWNSLKDDRINDYGILVASCNNAAVENVTKELPVSGGIQDALRTGKEDPHELREMLAEIQRLFDAGQTEDEECIEGNWKSEIYFTEYAKALLKNDDIWGLIAAPLGRKSNLADFYFNVLYPLHRDFYKRNSDIEERLEKYQEARGLFRHQLEKVRTMQNKLQRICNLAQDRLDAWEENYILQEEQKRQRAEYEAAVCDLDAEKKELEQKSLELENHIEKDFHVKQKLEFVLNEHGQRAEEKSAKKREYLEKETEVRDSIGLLDRFFKKNDRMAKLQLADEYHLQADKAETEYQRILEEMEHIREKLEQAKKEYDRTMSDKQRVVAEIGRREAEVRGLAEEYIKVEKVAEDSARKAQKVEQAYYSAVKAFKEAAPIDSGVVLDMKFVDDLLSKEESLSVSAQIKDPWFTERYNREREKLFYLAMKLNKEFVLASKRCRDNLITLSQYWGMKPDENNERITFAKEDREAFAAALYQTLFLVVPVLSSTFASMGTFLRDIKKPQSLGTLVVDEAGQAQPQMALGALFRCRKAVIVGDPKQVEPVVTDDLNLLKKTFDDEELRPYRSKLLSVQNFADKMNGFGTYLDNGSDYPDWVGCPLLVHRRCISPMYDISNEISYNGIMKQQTRQPGRAKSESFVYDRSQWINVDGKEAGRKDHFVEAQGEKVCEILEKAFTKASVPDLFIISPFTSVVRGIKRYISDYKKLHPGSRLSGCKEEWMKKHIGTVHIFQGKEAAEVIFLLGCDKSREAAGAVRWVNTNIVNVAATRAKYRLYVIGDEAVWRNSEVINRAKNIINAFAIRQIKSILEQDMPDDEKKNALADASYTLPPATSFHTEISEDEDGGIEYSVDTEGLLSALKPEFAESTLTKDQLQAFGFDSDKMMERLPKQIQDNLRLGIRLYYLLQMVYEANPKLDASCCSVLFCKAIELQMKECFGGSFRKMFPDHMINGRMSFAKVDIAKLTLGNFHNIMVKNLNKLADRMKERGELQYDLQWWRRYAERIDQCAKKRNRCCHSGLFTWEDQKSLISEIFLKDEPEVKQGNSPVMRGALFEAEVGRRL